MIIEKKAVPLHQISNEYEKNANHSFVLGVVDGTSIGGSRGCCYADEALC